MEEAILGIHRSLLTRSEEPSIYGKKRRKNIRNGRNTNVHEISSVGIADDEKKTYKCSQIFKILIMVLDFDNTLIAFRILDQMA